MLLILGIAFGFRLYTWSQSPLALSDEGAEYARIAENLWNGKGYLGTIDTGSGPQLTHSPLYPTLVAAFIPLTGSAETAAVLISVLMGVLLVLPVFSLAGHLYGRSVAWIAALLVAVHPYFVWLSATAYSESTFVMLMMAGIYWGVRSLHVSANLRDVILAGSMFGLAYLARPTAIVYPVVTACCMLLAAIINHHGWKRALSHGALMVGICVLFAAPYVAFQYSITAQLRIESKSPIVYAIAERALSGKNQQEASFGIDEKLNQTGPQLDHTAYILKNIQNPVSHDVLHLYAEYAPQNVLLYGKKLFKYATVLIPILALFGLFRSLWSRGRLIPEVNLALLFAATLLPLLSLSFTAARFSAPLIPFLIPWAAKGAWEGYEWFKDKGRSYGIHWLDTLWFRVAAVIGLLVIINGMAVVNPIVKPSGHTLDRKVAGLWLENHQPGHKQVMDLGPLIPYYAKGAWLPLPYANSALALRYLHQQDPDFIVLDGGDINNRPYMESWLADGIPDAAAHLIYEAGNTPERTIKIYSWSPEK